VLDVIAFAVARHNYYARFAVGMALVDTVTSPLPIQFKAVP
jgi:hypothetical protein